jgi:hypothetical protein
MKILLPFLFTIFFYNCTYLAAVEKTSREQKQINSYISWANVNEVVAEIVKYALADSNGVNYKIAIEYQKKNGYCKLTFSRPTSKAPQTVIQVAVFPPNDYSQPIFIQMTYELPKSLITPANIKRILKLNNEWMKNDEVRHIVYLKNNELIFYDSLVIPEKKIKLPTEMVFNAINNIHFLWPEYYKQLKKILK